MAASRPGRAAGLNTRHGARTDGCSASSSSERSRDGSARRRLPKCDRRHSERAGDALNIAPMSDILTYNPVLFDERNERPFLIAFVVTVAEWAVALLLVLA
jgi:hypothetical protein